MIEEFVNHETAAEYQPVDVETFSSARIDFDC